MQLFHNQLSTTVMAASLKSENNSDHSFPIEELIDILECPICLISLTTSPIYRCENGHLLCNQCRSKVENCPECRIPLGNLRCLTSEKIVATMSTMAEINSLKRNREQKIKELKAHNEEMKTELNRQNFELKEKNDFISTMMNEMDIINTELQEKQILKEENENLLTTLQNLELQNENTQRLLATRIRSLELELNECKIEFGRKISRLTHDKHLDKQKIEREKKMLCQVRQQKDMHLEAEIVSDNPEENQKLHNSQDDISLIEDNNRDVNCQSSNNSDNKISRNLDSERSIELSNSTEKGLLKEASHAEENNAFNIASCKVDPRVEELLQDSKYLFGRGRGIEGHCNSCSIDATLFALFAFTSAFDEMLIRPPIEGDSHVYTYIQEVLRDKIVNPLRKDKFVEANNAIELEKRLEIVQSANYQIDPLEFIDLLMAKALNVKPYLEISTGQKSFCYQLFVASDPSRRSSPTVQEIFLQSFKESNITLMTVPKILILQMPRNGVINKVFDQILPTKFLDVTDVVEEENGGGKILMNLFAVLCIETSHYVSFNRCGPDPDSDWCFFDSMADRIGVSGKNDGMQQEYNVPEISKVKEISKCFKNMTKENLHDKSPFENVEEILSKRLIKDSYVAFYECVAGTK